MKFYKICRIRCKCCGDILEYINRSKDDRSGVLRFCSCKKVGLDAAACMYRILGESKHYEDLSEEWPEEESDSELLEPCPFCGSKKIEIQEWDENIHGFWISCEDCGATGPNGSTEAEAIGRWNRRV